MDRVRVVETTKEWEIYLSCTPEEAPAVAAALPKMIAAYGGSYEPDTIHIHQALQAAAEAQSLPHVRRRALTGRN